MLAWEPILLMVSLAATIWVIYDVIAKQKTMTKGMKALWIVLVLILGIIGAIIYYFFGKKE